MQEQRHSDVERGFPTNVQPIVEQQETDSDEAPFLEKATEQPPRVNARLISDATIGLSDGLTVPFALTAGLSALGDTRVVIFGGMAELIAGSISMGLGGFLGARSEAESYSATLAETRKTVQTSPTQTNALVRSTFADFDVPPELLDSLSAHLAASETRATDFLMRHHHGLEQQCFEPRRAYISGATIAAGYFFGGFVPLIPYFFASTVAVGLVVSVALMAIALFAFGFVKTSLVGERRWMVCTYNGLQMMMLGGLAAAAAVGCVMLASLFDDRIRAGS